MDRKAHDKKVNRLINPRWYEKIADFLAGRERIRIVGTEASKQHAERLEDNHD